MQRALSIVFSLAAVALSAVLALRGVPEAATPVAPAPTDAGLAGDSAAASIPVAVDAAPVEVSEPPPVEVPPGGFHLADGTPIAPLGKGAPRHVRFGVVLVSYEGAEGAPEKGARHKADALAAATKLAEDAKGDFKATVQRGDSGSAEDVGEVTRGVLEPAPEAVLFALPVGGVSGVVDTPRGFWIVKRLQ
jgi:hypothetical protein